MHTVNNFEEADKTCEWNAASFRALGNWKHLSLLRAVAVEHTWHGSAHTGLRNSPWVFEMCEFPELAELWMIWAGAGTACDMWVLGSMSHLISFNSYVIEWVFKCSGVFWDGWLSCLVWYDHCILMLRFVSFALSNILESTSQHLSPDVTCQSNQRWSWTISSAGAQHLDHRPDPGLGTYLLAPLKCCQSTQYVSSALEDSFPLAVLIGYIFSLWV